MVLARPRRQDRPGQPAAARAHQPARLDPPGAVAALRCRRARAVRGRGQLPGAAGPARERAEGHPRPGARRAQGLRHRGRRDPVRAERRARDRQAGPDQAVDLPGRPDRGAGRGQPAALLADGAAPRRDGGRLLRRRGRQDSGAGRGDAFDRAPLCLRRVREAPGQAQAAPGAQWAVQRQPGADRQRARRQDQATGRQDRPRAGRRALQRPGHAAPQSRPQVAPDARLDRGTRAQAGLDPRQRRAPGEAGRPPGLRDLQRAGGRERGDRRAVPRRASRLHAGAGQQGAGRAAHRARYRRLPVAVAASPCHRWFLRGRAGAAREAGQAGCRQGRRRGGGPADAAEADAAEAVEAKAVEAKADAAGAEAADEAS